MLCPFLQVANKVGGYYEYANEANVFCVELFFSIFKWLRVSNVCFGEISLVFLHFANKYTNVANGQHVELFFFF